MEEAKGSCFTINVNSGGNQIAQTITNTFHGNVTFGSQSGDTAHVTDEQLVKAIAAINGKGKPLSQYQLWLGVCCILGWKYGYPRDIRRCCERINQLPWGDIELEYECKIDGFRKYISSPFVKEDARNWSRYSPVDSERNLFNNCLQVADALVAEIENQADSK